MSNLVFMGMGEPFHNYDKTLQAIRILNMPEGLNLGARHMTISTVGLVPGILRLAEEPLQMNLAISLHAPNNAMRLRTMPVTRKYPIAQVFAACRTSAARTNRQVTFEYVLLAGVNDAPELARELAALLSPLRQLCHVNLIPVNDTAARYTGQRARRSAPSARHCARAASTIACAPNAATTSPPPVASSARASAANRRRKLRRIDAARMHFGCRPCTQTHSIAHLTSPARYIIASLLPQQWRCYDLV